MLNSKSEDTRLSREVESAFRGRECIFIGFEISSIGQDIIYSRDPYKGRESDLEAHRGLAEAVRVSIEPRRAFTPDAVRVIEKSMRAASTGRERALRGLCEYL
jgi:hypothetical protein